MQLTAILEFKKNRRFLYNSSKYPLNENGYIPVFDKPEPIEKIANFVSLLEMNFPEHLHCEVEQIKKYWISFNQGWEVCRILSVA